MKATFDTDTLRSEITSHKAQIANLEAEIETKEYLISMIKKASTGAKVKDEKNIIERVREVYYADMEKVITLKELQELLPDIQYGSLSMALSQLVQSGTIDRLSRGEYQYGQTIGRVNSN